MQSHCCPQKLSCNTRMKLLPFRQLEEENMMQHYNSHREDHTEADLKFKETSKQSREACYNIC